MRLRTGGSVNPRLATESVHAPVIQALQALRGVREITAVNLMAEAGQFTRFSNPAQLMVYSGVVPRKRLSGARIRLQPWRKIVHCN